MQKILRSHLLDCFLRSQVFRTQVAGELGVQVEGLAPLGLFQLVPKQEQAPGDSDIGCEEGSVGNNQVGEWRPLVVDEQNEGAYFGADGECQRGDGCDEQLSVFEFNSDQSLQGVGSKEGV